MVFYSHFVQNLWSVIYLSLHRSTRKIQLNALWEPETQCSENTGRSPTLLVPWILSRIEGFYLSTFSYCNYRSQAWSTSFTSIASGLGLRVCLESCLKNSPTTQWATALLMLYFLMLFFMLLLRRIQIQNSVVPTV